MWFILYNKLTSLATRFCLKVIEKSKWNFNKTTFIVHPLHLLLVGLCMVQCLMLKDQQAASVIIKGTFSKSKYCESLSIKCWSQNCSTLLKLISSYQVSPWSGAAVAKCNYTAGSWQHRAAGHWPETRNLAAPPRHHRYSFIYLHYLLQLQTNRR